MPLLDEMAQFVCPNTIGPCPTLNLDAIGCWNLGPDFNTTDDPPQKLWLARCYEAAVRFRVDA